MALLALLLSTLLLMLGIRLAHAESAGPSMIGAAEASEAGGRAPAVRPLP